MAELEIRAARQADLDRMFALDHASSSSYAYKMEVLDEKDGFSRSFQRVRLPRMVTLSYPRDEAGLLNSWNEANAILVGGILDEVVAYAALEMGKIRDSARVSDLVVTPSLRRKGIGQPLALWPLKAGHMRQDAYRLLVEVQARNDPAIKMVLKLGYELCGYLDQYFPNKETASLFRNESDVLHIAGIPIYGYPDLDPRDAFADLYCWRSHYCDCFADVFLGVQPQRQAGTHVCDGSGAGRVHVHDRNNCQYF